MDDLLKSAASVITTFLGSPVVWLGLGLFWVARWLNSRRGQGARGEAVVRLALRWHLAASRYHSLHGILIRKPDGDTTELDHIVVSVYGIFVVETKHWKGWIKGTEDSMEWRVFYGKGRKKIRQNPVRQNANHIKALASLLDLPISVFHNLVFMAGTAELKDGPLPGVLQSGLATHIKSYQAILLTPAQVQACTVRIRQASLSKIRGAKAAHIAAVRERQLRPKS